MAWDATLRQSRLHMAGQECLRTGIPTMDVIGMLLTALYGTAQEQGIAGADFFGIKESRVSKS